MPAARLLVPAMEILEYVSPRELENWETEMEQELNEDRAKLEEEKNSIQPSLEKRKRGRPPKHAKIESAAAAELEADEDSKGRLMGGALSLSTPKKTRMKDFEGLSDDEGSPSRQLEKEQYDTLVYAEDRKEGVEMEEYYEDAVEEMEYDDSSAKEEHATSYAKPDDLGSVPPFGLQRTRGSPDELAADNDPSGTQSPRSSLLAVRSLGRCSRRNSPLPEPYVNSFTPAGVAVGRLRHRSTPQEAADPLSAASSRSTPELSNMMKSHSPQTASAANLKPPKRKKPRKSAPERKPVQVEEEDQWVIQGLENDALYDVEGKGLVRYFKVRWEGDWAPNQNPSWEPEDNIPPKMVRSYSKRTGDTKPNANKAKQTNQTKSSRTNGERYSSVSEEFAGDEANCLEWQGADDDGIGNDAQADESDGDKELLVMDKAYNACSKSPPRGTGTELVFLEFGGASKV